MGHEIFQAYIDIYIDMIRIYEMHTDMICILICSIFLILLFKLRGLEHKIPKLAIKET